MKQIHDEHFSQKNPTLAYVWFALLVVRHCSSFFAKDAELRTHNQRGRSEMCRLMTRIAENLDFRRGHWLSYVEETIISGQIRVFAIIVAEVFSK